MSDSDFLLYCDGASRGNPGSAAAGGHWQDASGTTILEYGRTLGRATNNVAEYQSLLIGLEELRAYLNDRGDDPAATRVAIRMDSELVVKQIKGQYRVKNAALRPLYEKVRGLLNDFAGGDIAHVRRAENSRADALANAALDTAS